jgi:uncharacterized protein DUF1206
MHSPEAARDNSAVRASARIGLIARGVLYAAVGVLALRLAFRQAHATADKNGALLAVARQPFGKALLVILAIGFASASTARCAASPKPRGDHFS